MSVLLLVLSIGTGFLEVILMNGAVFGWTFMQEILEEKGYFAHQCYNETKYNNFSAVNETALNCDNQEASFSLIFTLSVALLRILAFPLGYCLDRFGTWKYRSALCVFLTIGWIIMSISSPLSSELLYPAVIFIGMSGYGLLLSNFQLANLTKSTRAVVVTLFQGLFGSSTVIFFLFKKGHDSGVDVHMFFNLMIGLSVLLFIRTFLFMPIKTLPFPLENKSIKYGWNQWGCVKKSESTDKNAKPETEITEKAQDVVKTVDKPIEKYDTQQSLLIKDSFKDCLRKPFLWSSVFHFSVISLRIDFLLGNLLYWLHTFINEEEVYTLADVSGFILMCNVFAAPLNGAIMDLVIKKMKKTTNRMDILHLTGGLAAMTCTSILVIILSIMVVIPSTYASFVFLMLGRAFIYGGVTAFVAINFPSQHFGKVFGINSLFAGLANMLQYVLIEISLSVDPTFVRINIALLVLSICTLIHPVVIYFSLKKMKKSSN